MGDMYDESFDKSGGPADLMDDSWVESVSWKDLLKKLHSIKFALQSGRDEITGLLAALNRQCPYSPYEQFPDKKVYFLLDSRANSALGVIQNASAFKRRADEKNAVAGVTNIPANPNTTVTTNQGSTTTTKANTGSTLEEDLYTYYKFDDASTAFHKSLTSLENMELKSYYRRNFEKVFGIKFGGAAASSSAPPPASGGPIRPNP
ncbi:22.3K [Tobacco rattle virus]|uniref:Capsid protein n=1 Tax=Tobacco rattle virus (isolate PpK20) TaxID=652939 RepID=CAPSD_TRVPP|nr:22.3K [Tobacco rattle virus]Q88897.1 RecName: Full=Capsid protein; AltName: Full=Coat protein; AltName: Full=P23 [Tobacco rattle virus PpK20]UOE99136.1 coat protein [Vector pLX-TRV2]WAK98722.1 coat protein [Tobacco rattle virus RNA2-based VIGS vector]UVC58663.1 coat protein [Tobacco rattle virus]WAK98715.1 coat protein [Tobacco rattle virus]CAA85421.1 22.3K [Tobacco rattle virus]